jgi:hypothetical protein
MELSFILGTPQYLINLLVSGIELLYFADLLGETADTSFFTLLACLELEQSLILGHLYYVGNIIEDKLILWLF